jgi:hypothetical protein
LTRDHDDVNEERVYVDGAHLWFVSVYEAGVNCHRGGILVADRRLLSEEDRKFIRQQLSVDDRVDLDDDAALERALKALPPLPPGRTESIQNAPQLER